MSQKQALILTPEGTVSFANVFTPKRNDLNGQNEYGLDLIFDEDTDLSPLREAYKEAVESKWGKKVPPELRNPIKDGDKKDDKYKEYHGKQYVTLKNIYRPRVYDENGVEIEEKDGTFYAGCRAVCSIRVYAYDRKGNRGVSFGLQNIKKTGDGDSLGGYVDTGGAEFGAVSNAEDAFLN